MIPTRTAAARALRRSEVIRRLVEGEGEGEDMTPSAWGKKIWRAIAPLAAIVVAPPAVVALYNSMQSERAALTITRIGLDPFPLIPNQRELLRLGCQSC